MDDSPTVEFTGNANGTSWPASDDWKTAPATVTITSTEAFLFRELAQLEVKVDALRKVVENLLTRMPTPKTLEDDGIEL